MSDPQDDTEAQFWKMVDRFIAQANENAKSLPHAGVGSALLFAAARYNAFNWTHRSQLLEQTLDEAAVLFRAEYEKMFRENANEMIVARASR